MAKGNNLQLFSLIGSIAMIIIPFAFTSWSSNKISSVSWLGFLSYYSSDKLFGSNSGVTKTFQLNWFNKGGVYETYFGTLYWIGIIVLISLIIALILSIVNVNKLIAPLILIIDSVLLVYMRLQVLSQNNSSFYTKTATNAPLFGTITSTYFEIPIGALIGLVFGIIQLVKDRK